MDETVNKSIRVQKSMFFAITVCECILAAVIILSLLAAKFFAPKTYKSVKKWYAENVQTETDVSEIIKGAADET